MEEFLKTLESIASNRVSQVIASLAAVFTALYQVIRYGPGFIKRTITIPLWAIGLLILGVYLVVINTRSADVSLVERKDFKLIKGEVFGEQVVDVAGKRFIRCDFEGTTIRITGLNGCEIGYSNLNRVRFIFAGPARSTLQMLTELYQIPATRPVVDTLFSDIRRGTVPIIAPINKSADN